MEPRGDGRGRRWARRGAIVVLGIAALQAALLLLPSGGPAMPDVLWAEGFTFDSDSETLRFRIGAADGPPLEEPRVHSQWSSGDGKLGVSVRRKLETAARWAVELARAGVVPVARVAAAGYETTGAEATVDGVRWVELRKFDDAFNVVSVGWAARW